MARKRMNATSGKRLAWEGQKLKANFPGFEIQFPDCPERARAIGPLHTNCGNRYVLRIPLGAFPYAPPEMYVVEPKPLRNRRGKKLSQIGSSGEMHLLAADEHGHPQICHYQDSVWTPNVTLYKVVLKGRLWLEAYELHKAKGHPIDRYLPHM